MNLCLGKKSLTVTCFDKNIQTISWFYKLELSFLKEKQKQGKNGLSIETCQLHGEWVASAERQQWTGLSGITGNRHSVLWIPNLCMKQISIVHNTMIEMTWLLCWKKTQARPLEFEISHMISARVKSGMTNSRYTDFILEFYVSVSEHIYSVCFLAYKNG